MPFYNTGYLMRRLFAIAVGAGILSGCASVKVLETSQVTEKIGRSPDLAQESLATVGSQVFEQYRYWSKTGYRLLDPVDTSLMLSRIIAKTGDFLVFGEYDGEQAYCTEHRALIDPLMGPQKFVCFLDRDKDGRFEAVKAAPGAVVFQTAVENRPRYEKSELVVENANGIKRELLYQGYSNNALRLSYREYVNDMARPSYFQDVSYEISSFPADVTFKTVKLQILGAGNTGLRYKVLSGF